MLWDLSAYVSVNLRTSTDGDTWTTVGSTLTATGSTSGWDTDTIDGTVVTLGWAPAIGFSGVPGKTYYAVLYDSDHDSENNFLTGSTHTVAGSDNLIAGIGGTVTGDQNALFALCTDSPAPSITGDHTFKVCADVIDLDAPTVTLNGAAIGDVTGPASSVDSEIALFSSTTGKVLKRATTTGLLKAASGVIAAASAGVDYLTPALVSGVTIGAASVSLTDAQIKALPTALVSLVSAPGSGKRIVPIKGVFRAVTTSGAYTNINATLCKLRLVYGNNIWVASWEVSDDSGAASTNFTQLLGGASVQSVVLHEWDGDPRAVADVENVAVGVSIDNNGSGDLTGGHASNSLVVSFLYLVIG